MNNTSCRLLLGGIGFLLFAACCYLLRLGIEDITFFVAGFAAQVIGGVLVLLGLTTTKKD